MMALQQSLPRVSRLAVVTVHPLSGLLHLDMISRKKRVSIISTLFHSPILTIYDSIYPETGCFLWCFSQTHCVECQCLDLMLTHFLVGQGLCLSWQSQLSRGFESNETARYDFFLLCGPQLIILGESILICIFGPEIHIAEIVSLALRIKPTKAPPVSSPVSPKVAPATLSTTVPTPSNIEVFMLLVSALNPTTWSFALTTLLCRMVMPPPGLLIDRSTLRPIASSTVSNLMLYRGCLVSTTCASVLIVCFVIKV